MRRLGIVAAGVLVVCLGAVFVAMAGGPQAPLTSWAAPHNQQSAGLPGHARDPDRLSRTHASPSPSVQASPKASSAVTHSPGTGSTTTPTNRAGHVAPGLTRSPNPHKK